MDTDTDMQLKRKMEAGNRGADDSRDPESKARAAGAPSIGASGGAGADTITPVLREGGRRRSRQKGKDGEEEGEGGEPVVRSNPPTGGTTATAGESVIAAQGSPMRGAKSGSVAASGSKEMAAGAGAGVDGGARGQGRAEEDEDQDEDSDDGISDSAAKQQRQKQDSEPESSVTAGAMLSALADALVTRAGEQKERMLLGFEQVLALLRLLGTACRELGALRIQRTRIALGAVPLPHASSPMVLALRGEAELEAGKFSLAAGHLQRAVDLSCREPRAQVLLSSVLWQLQRAGELGLLSETLSRSMPGRAETWIVSGNSRALLRDHAGALACFRRAARLAPSMAEAHVLAGHEHLACGDIAAAETRYRSAMHFSPRCYRAWYGLGMAATRKDVPQDAAAAFEQALQLHPGSAVLRVSYAHALHCSGQREAALSQAVEALRLDSGNPQALFAAARWRLDDGNDARGARGLLLRLRRICPREPAVLVLAARASRRLGLRAEAAGLYGRALELGPRDAADVRAALESLEGKLEADAEGNHGDAYEDQNDNDIESEDEHEDGADGS